MKTNIKTILLVFIFSVAILLTYVSLKFFVYSGTVEKIALDNGEKKVFERERFFQSYLNSAQNKLKQLRLSSSFDRFITSHYSDDTMLDELLQNVIKCNQDILKIKFIDPLGSDIIGYESIKDEIVEIKKLQLTNNYNWDHFFDMAKSKDLEKTYFSQITLDKNQTPILRVFIPISYKNSFGGILYADYDMSLFFSKFADTPIYDMVLLDDDGYALLHYMEEKSWGFYNNPQINLLQEYPMVSKAKYLRTDTLVYHKLDLPFEKNLNLVLQLKNDHLATQKKIEKQEVVVISLIVIGISLFLSILLGKIINGLNSNITNLQNLKDKLEVQKQEFETLFYSSRDGLAVVDMLSNFKKVNNAFCEISGFSQKELLQSSCFGFSSYEHIELSKKIFEEVKNFGYVENFEKVCIFGQKHITVNISMSLLPDKKSILISLRDVDKAKLNEQQAKLASMGEMIGNIAHQWRQPLSVISTSATGLKMQLEMGLEVSDEELIKYCEDINNQAQYLSKTIDDFRNFIKNDKNKAEFKVSNILNEASSLLHATLLSKRIELIKDFRCDCVVSGYPNELTQAIMNIINNSKDALIANISDNEKRLIFIETRAFNNEVEIYIKDNGKGIPEDIKEKIFEPYFTTKHQSQGTGIGLYMTRQIIVGHNDGKITAQNVEFEYDNINQKGAVIIISLPCIGK